MTHPGSGSRDTLSNQPKSSSLLTVLLGKLHACGDVVYADISETVSTTRAWQVYWGLNGVGANGAGAATTLRQGKGVFSSSWIADANCALTTGSHSLQVAAVGPTNFSDVIVSIKPAVLP